MGGGFGRENEWKGEEMRREEETQRQCVFVWEDYLLFVFDIDVLRTSLLFVFHGTRILISRADKVLNRPKVG